MLTVPTEFHRRVDRLKERVFVYAGEDEVALVYGLGALRACADADCRERMSNACEEGGLLRESAAVAHHRERVHLKAIVVMETERFVLDDARVEFEAGLRETVAAARVAAVENRNVVFLGHRVDGIEQAEEVLLRVYVLLPVGTEKDVMAFLQSQTGVDVACFDFREIVVENLSHRGACDECAFFRQTAVGEVAAGMFAVGHVHVTYDVHDAAVGLLRKALVLAAVAGFHVEYRDVEAFRSYDAEAAVRVAEDKDCIRTGLDHQLIGAVDDVPAGRAEVIANRVHVHLRFCEFEVAEEDAVEVVVVVLASMREYRVEVLAAFGDDCRETDDFRARADYDEEFQFAVFGELDSAVICSNLLGHNYLKLFCFDNILYYLCG